MSLDIFFHPALKYGSSLEKDKGVCEATMMVPNPLSPQCLESGQLTELSSASLVY